MIKRLLLSLAAVLLFCLSSLAEVQVRNIDGTNVEITFTYKDDVASQMNVIGSFDGWTVPGEPMTKSAAGLWVFVLKAKASDEIQYKFYNNGAWIFDFKAPDKKDDGFGGNNGLIVVADLLAGQPSGSKGAAGPALALPTRKKVGFGTLTWVESASTFTTDKGAFVGAGSKIDAYSLWSFTGDFAPGMPGNIELTLFSGQSSLWGGALAPSDGFQNLASGFVFNPAYYLGGNTRPAFDKLRFGFELPWLSYETTYSNVYFPAHRSVIWDTVLDSENDSSQPALYAGPGYSSFRLGPALRTVGDFSIDAALVPNRSQDGFYGLYGFANATLGTMKLEAQYDIRSSATGDALAILKNIPRQDLILGFQAYPDQFSVKAQALLSMYLQGGSVEGRPLADKVAAELLVGYIDFFDVYAFNFDIKYRGYAAQMIYANSDKVLGSADTQTFGADGYYRLGHWVTAKMAASVVLPNVATSASNVALYLTPGVALDFSVPARRPLTADLYGKVRLDTAPTAPASTLNFTTVAAKVSVGELVPGIIQNLDLFYGLNNYSSSAMFNSLLVEAKLPGDLTTQLGLGLRSGSSVANPFGASIGASWVLPIPQAKTPTLYCQLVYNMDPYDSDGRISYAFDSDNAYLPLNGYGTFDGTSAVRLGILWNF